jgi:hypothetical protein
MELRDDDFVVFGASLQTTIIMVKDMNMFRRNNTTIESPFPIDISFFDNKPLNYGKQKK